MAEQEAVAAQAQVDEEEEETPGYKAPAQKSMKEIVEQDKEDESLVKYKQALLGGSGDIIIDPNNPHRVIVKKLAILVQDRDPVELDLTQPLNDIKNTKIVLKEGCKYKVRIFFNVQREIVTGLKYHHKTSRKGIQVDKDTFMVGSYGPSEDEYSYTTPEEDVPAGMLARGEYKMKSKFVDDDKNVYLEWEWTLVIKKDFE